MIAPWPVCDVCQAEYRPAPGKKHCSEEHRKEAWRADHTPDGWKIVRKKYDPERRCPICNDDLTWYRHRLEPETVPVRMARRSDAKTCGDAWCRAQLAARERGEAVAA